MVMTILEASVSPRKWEDLKKRYEHLINEAIPPFLLQSFLVQSAEDVNVWQLITVWRSREELEDMRKKGTPRGIQLFRDVGSEPSVSVCDVIAAAPLGLEQISPSIH